MAISDRRIREFRETVWNHYRTYGRDFPWRDPDDPYHILVSEVMLQQTQAERVVGYYERFIERFPDIGSLSRARLSTVLKLWQGLGYNRRAKALHDLAKTVVREHGGKLPASEAELVQLPGIGPYTAAAIAAFAGNRPTIVIETNIRSVFIHEFFADREQVSDAEILPLIEATVDRENPRDWYSALMDYGAYLKKQGINPSRRSAHYTRQTAYAGSNREARGAVLKAVAVRPASPAQVERRLGLEPARTKKAIAELLRDGLLVRKGAVLRLP